MRMGYWLLWANANSDMGYVGADSGMFLRIVCLSGIGMKSLIAHFITGTNPNTQQDVNRSNDTVCCVWGK